MSRRRDPDLVADIGAAIGRIRRYTQGLNYAAFLTDTLVQDAVVRNLEIVGEAAKGLSPEFRRDRLIHHYTCVNWEIVWDVIRTKLPELERQLRAKKP